MDSWLFWDDEACASMEDLPDYGTVDPDAFTSRLDSTELVQLPILHARTSFNSFPPRLVFGPFTSPPTPRNDPEREARVLEDDIVSAFYYAMWKGHDDVVAAFISRGLVSPDITSDSGLTPLVAAVQLGSLPLISTLVAHGATVDMLANVQPRVSSPTSRRRRRMRTPLQVAARDGKLAIVKVLYRDYGADDAIIAPDGAMALRLAAANGHREIVDLLPARRGGAWLRWKTAHEREMEIVQSMLHRIRRALFCVLWQVPKYLLYQLPKHAAVQAWEGRHRALEWVKHTVKSLPRRVRKVIIGLPRYANILARVLFRLAERSLTAIWKVIKAIPAVLKIMLRLVEQALQKVGGFIKDGVARLLSLLHTVISAMLSSFQKITLGDVRNGLYYLARAVFIEGPALAAELGRAFLRACKSAFRVISNGLNLLLVHLILYAIVCIPENLWLGTKAIGRSFRRAYREFRAHLNPKHM